MCNYDQGKDDFFRAVEFVFGADLAELRVQTPLDLVHKLLREKFLLNHEIQTYVEVVISVPQEDKLHKFCRTVKKGRNSTRLEHKVSDNITSYVSYQKKLQSLNLFIKKKNLIFYKNYFNSVIWGSPEDLEMIISDCLREKYLLEEWKKIKKEVDRLKVLKGRMAEKHYNAVKNSHFVIERHAKQYETTLAYRESSKKEILQHSLVNGNLSLDESIPLQDDSKNGDTFKEFEDEKKSIESLEMKIEAQKQTLYILQLREAELVSSLHHEEIKLGSKPVNTSVLQNRLSQVKLSIREKETRISEIWRKSFELESELKSANERASDSLVSLREMERNKYLENRLTTYGRFSDYLQPSRNVNLLRQIIGDEIFYANLCDSTDEAMSSLDFMTNLKYESREVFIPFQNYSHKLKDLLVGSGEKGIRLDTLEELLIFLCKLKFFNLIDEVPAINQKEFNFDDSIPDDHVIYVQNNIHFTSDGLISYKASEDIFCAESDEKNLRKDILQLQAQQEINFQKLNDLFFLRYETLVDINSLQTDYFNLKQNWKKSAQRPYPVMESPKIPEIYKEYSHVFEHYNEVWQKCKSEVQQAEEPFFDDGDSSTSREKSLQYMAKQLEDVGIEKMKIKNELELLTEELRWIYAISTNARMPEKYPIKIQNNTNKEKIFFEKEFKRLRRLMKDDELLNFLGNQEWRKHLIDSLVKDFDGIKKNLKLSSEELQKVATQRKIKLHPLFEHCGRYLSSTFNQILDNALPFVEINFFSGEEKIHITSSLGTDKINIVDIAHFNTFLKFACALSVFLEISKFENIPVVIFDDLEEFFPIGDNIDALMDLSLPEKLIQDDKDSTFHLMMRTGQFLKQFIKKNSPGNHILKNGKKKDYSSGPAQIIYFSKGDLIQAAEHFIWIQSQILPEEYISEYCNSYSRIQEIHFF